MSRYRQLLDGPCAPTSDTSKSRQLLNIRNLCAPASDTDSVQNQCNQAIMSIIRANIELASKIASGQSTKSRDTAELQWFIDFTQEFGDITPDFQEVIRNLTNAKEAASLDSISITTETQARDETLADWVNGICAWAILCRPNRVGEVVNYSLPCNSDTSDGSGRLRFNKDAITSVKFWRSRRYVHMVKFVPQTNLTNKLRRFVLGFSWKSL